MSSNLRYNRVRDHRRSFHGTCKGFRLNARRFSVYRLRAKFYYLFKILSGRWRSWYKHARNICHSRPKKDSAKFVSQNAYPRVQSRLRSFGRSNSFYSEAIADCLEFIKRSSVGVDDNTRDQEEYALVQEKFHVTRS
ncbi:Serine/threonine-protein phosphatase [Heracleum sosnowskyi]|uniref:Serine/threonine-protein phosphatase n=1 Tax=Heracleum sosnowskyi TaxID=360622 RepID=A0AAD8H966_9APIA|nr:Serine/threonine-protein phosphatase [Heracleum sosnowskyi]